MQLFISYAHRDREEVAKLVQILREGGHQPWFDESLIVGRDWQEQLHQAIQNADAFVYVLTPESLASEWCQWEFVTAIKLGKSIIPVLLKDTQLPVVLRSLQFADFRQGATQEARRKLLEGLAGITFVIPPQTAPEAPTKPRGEPAQAVVEQDVTVGDVSGQVNVIGVQNNAGQTNIYGEKQLSWTVPVILGLILAFLALAATVVALLPSLQKDAFLYQIGLIGPSETPTISPSETPVPTVTPTPLAGATAVTTGSQREVLVLIAKFQQISGNPLEPDKEWEIVLNKAAQEIEQDIRVRVVRIPTVVTTRDQARDESDIYRATLVIWGNVRGAAIESNYTVTPRWQFVSMRLGSTEIQGTQDELNLFVSPGGDSEYVLNFVLAQLSFFGDSPDDALPFLNKAIELKPVGREKELGVDSIYFYRAYIRQSSDGDLFEIIDDYSEAIDINPNNVYALNNRAVAYSDLEWYEDALTDYNRAVELQPNSALFYNNRGVAFAGIEDFDSALADHSKAIELQRNYPDAYYNRGIAYAQRGEYSGDTTDFEKAIQDYDQAIEQQADYVDAYNNRAIAYVHLGEFEKAIDDYTQAIQLKSDDAKLYCNRSKAYEQIGNDDLSFQDAEQAINLDPNYDPIAFSGLPLCEGSAPVSLD